MVSAAGVRRRAVPLGLGRGSLSFLSERSALLLDRSVCLCVVRERDAQGSLSFLASPVHIWDYQQEQCG